MIKNRPKPLVLLILDGWGVAATSENNAIAFAHKPNFNKLVASYPAMTLKVASGQASSEAGHFIIGTGQPWLNQATKVHLPKIISQAKLSQFYISETEKYAQINYYFKGCQEGRISGGVMELIPSLHLSSPDEEPSLAANKIARILIKRIINDQFDFLVANFANPHLVAKTGNKPATARAIETIDKHLGKIVKNVLAKEGAVIITADHGRAEAVDNLGFGRDYCPINPVPFLVIHSQLEGRNIGQLDTLESDLSLIEPSGDLLDIAPTILKIMNLPQPKEMIGKSLI